ncbi:MAG: phosphoribosylamine--glycine ligase [Candidatus Omnitrophica bacterium]|nr:phosphoribosylamine--glycine ligase [Candidatus Omnitrophota bacterium]
MKILVIGAGGREHALIWKIAQSPLVQKIYAAPGNAGIEGLAECVNISVDQINDMKEFALNQRIDLTVVGPELPLTHGIVDLFQAAGLQIFGPSREAAQLEGSKAFSKRLLAEVGVPTAAFQIFDNVNEAKRFIVDREPPFVIKADGLASGKGVLIARSCEEGIQIVNQMIQNRLFGDSGKLVVIEEFFTGDELSVLLFTDGERIVPLASSQDHKRAFDDDQGPNTGGMGAYSPCPFISDQELNGIVEKTARPVIQELKRRNNPYRGLLYVGIMMTRSGPQVLEYNVRFGDPEAQAILPRLKTDIVPIMLEIAAGKLKTQSLEWDPRPCLTVVMASQGYPGTYQCGFEIKGLDQVKSDRAFVFHAGTTREISGKITTSGGRVLTVSALGESFKEARDLAYQSVDKISFQGAFYRKDIGKRAFEKTEVR